MCTLEDFKRIVNENQIENACVFAMLTDAIIFDNWPVEITEGKLLDIRVFNTDKEAHMFRTSIDKAFFDIRIADDTQKQNEDRMVEWQILDIDTKVSRDPSNKVTSTGGGKYTLPRIEGISIMDGSDKPALKIVKYIAYTESGQAYIYDWRLAGIEMRGLDKLKEKENRSNGSK